MMVTAPSCLQSDGYGYVQPWGIGSGYSGGRGGGKAFRQHAQKQVKNVRNRKKMRFASITIVFQKIHFNALVELTFHGWLQRQWIENLQKKPPFSGMYERRLDREVHDFSKMSIMISDCWSNYRWPPGSICC